MAGERGNAPLLSDSTAVFIEGGVSMIGCSCHPDKTPAMARAVGCRVSPDRQNITLLFPKSWSTDLFEAVRQSGRLATVYSLPSSALTIQLKGRAEITRAPKDAAVIVARYADAFVADVCPLGYAEEMIRAVLSCAPADLCAVTFRIDQAFDQTPGPRAGEPLK
jgi:hypothetical protein